MHLQAPSHTLRNHGLPAVGLWLAQALLSAGLLLTSPSIAVAATNSTKTAKQTASIPLIVRARATLAANVGPMMQVHVGGVLVGSVEVRATAFQDYSIVIPPLATGAKVDIVFTNDAVINGEDRNLYIAYVSQGSAALLPNAPGGTYDRGTGSKAFDGIDVIAGQGEMAWSGALRLIWPATAVQQTAMEARRNEASRFLQQATF